jgi:hypothetical protein
MEIMPYSLLALDRDHPHRPPDWRWRLANHLADDPDDPFALARADLWVAQALLLARALRDAPMPAAPDPSALRAAYEIYAGADQLRRWVLAGHLLTGEPLEQVAARCGVARDVVATYSEVFCHVRDRLRATSYVTHRVIGPQLQYGLAEDDAGVLLKIAGCMGSGAVVDLVARYFRRPPTSDEAIDGQDPAGPGRLLRPAARAALGGDPGGAGQRGDRDRRPPLRRRALAAHPASGRGGDFHAGPGGANAAAHKPSSLAR